MRTIDADAVLDWIKRQKESTDRALDVLITGETVLTVQSCLSEFYRKVKKQPIAFDVEKVVALLEEELKLADDEKARCIKENPMQFDSAKGYAHGIAVAIEIVKRGGVDEK